MKKYCLLLLIAFSFLQGKSQNSLPDSIELNLLNAPANPAFNLMGISPSQIDRPTDLNNFRISIQNATNSFTKIPSNYAVEFSPAGLFDIKSQTLQKFNSTDFKDVFWQSLSVSFGLSKSNKQDIETGDSTSFTKLGFGFKFSIVRPKWNSNTVQKIENFYALERVTLDEYKKRVNLNGNQQIAGIQSQLIAMAQSSDPAKQAKIDALTKQLAKVRDSLTTVISTELKDEDTRTALAIAMDTLSKYAKGLKIERKGPFLDFATGGALDFPDNTFDYSMVSKAGAWITGGYEGGNKGFSALFIGRYLFQPDKIYADDKGIIKSADISTFDAGGRALYSSLNGKFTASIEYIYRSLLNKDIIPASSRFVFNTEYDVGFNQKLTLSIGKNFDGTVTRTGSVIAALNFIKGFGSTKKL